ncbi:PRC-barrel domain-containing protein [Pseudosulfitobacter koreensis]|uniref:PRC-barrel domain-containing protein n=1 Tax=Pseudosulfitobacter koreensis TaxID=2968472 RepID=A0ABT1YYL3_9RHOB|nr:PRC-barrel domain-containing protein [Pseudosulfitobacter koreense]MCR8825967.1 PRC-barrel domain-containing protein [Pseudosulfitobacter koreense]
MTLYSKQLLAGVSAVALLAAAPLAAQTSDEPAATADVAGGQVVVEQEDATVDVTVPDPDVNVSQEAPVVTVEQGQPEVTVAVPEPTVRVQQQAPIITVEQAQPQVTVRIPEPVVTVMVPQPEVDVETGEPIVDLEQPEPVVRFVRPEPRITIEEAEPRITVESAEANVNVAAAENPEVSVERSEAEVNVQQGEDANVVVGAAPQPEVNVEGADQADIDVMQQQARVVLEDYNADEQGNMAEADRERYQAEVAVLPIFRLRVEELTGRNVATEMGEDVGEIDAVGMRGDTLVAIVGVGGFLGMGENNVAIPLEKLIMQGNEVIVPGVTEERLEMMPEFNEAEVRVLQPGVVMADELGM